MRWVADEQLTSARSRIPSWWSPWAPRPMRPAHPGRRLALTIIAILVVAGLVAALVAFKIERSRFHTIVGALDVGTTQISSACRLAPIYHGIREGTPVVVRDSRHAVIGTSTLGPGAGVGPYCEFIFRVRVPNRDLYWIEVDHRGQIAYSRAYFDFFRWRAGLALRGAKMTWL